MRAATYPAPHPHVSKRSHFKPPQDTTFVNISFCTNTPTQGVKQRSTDLATRWPNARNPHADGVKVGRRQGDIRTARHHCLRNEAMPPRQTGAPRQAAPPHPGLVSEAEGNPRRNDQTTHEHALLTPTLTVDYTPSGGADVDDFTETTVDARQPLIPTTTEPPQHDKEALAHVIDTRRHDDANQHVRHSAGEPSRGSNHTNHHDRTLAHGNYRTCVNEMRMSATMTDAPPQAASTPNGTHIGGT